MADNLVIVESPAKAKTIKKYLGRDFEVLASYGHVRDLVPKEGAVDPDDGFRMKYQLLDKNERHVEAIARALRKAKALYLATDPDREGEAIAWHLKEILEARGDLEGKDVHRVVFYEITRNAIRAAVGQPRGLSLELVNAQQARRALDYLVGFNLSPLLWKKVRRGLSAGRVQSPALRMICEREEEIGAFVAQEYWTIEGEGAHASQSFPLKLLEYRGGKVEQFTFTNETAAREVAAKLYGKDEVAEEPRIYKTKSKNAQEAHEAIRPTAAAITPADVEGKIEDDLSRLYALIWKRAVASQMSHALFDTVAVDLLAGPDGAQRHLLRANGSTLVKPGYMSVYQEGTDDAKAADDSDHVLPPMNEGDAVQLAALAANQHFTEPPPRYSEASLVKALEEHGIGRPSTYASIISTLQDREYVDMDSRRFVPTDIGKIVNRFLTHHFHRYVEYGFTAAMEDELDAVSRGEEEWTTPLDKFWKPFIQQVEKIERTVTREQVAQARELGRDPATGKPIAVRMGRYGPFVQIGTKDDEEKPRFAGLRPGQKMDAITLADAMELFKLPRTLGETAHGETILANVGRFGPYVKYGSKYASLKEDDPYTVTLERAREVIRLKQEADANRIIQDFPAEGIQVLNGRYGPYITDRKKNAKIPKDRDPKALTLEECRALLAAAPERGARFGRWGKGKRAAAAAPADGAGAPQAPATGARVAGAGRKSARGVRAQPVAAAHLSAAPAPAAKPKAGAHAARKPRARARSAARKAPAGKVRPTAPAAHGRAPPPKERTRLPRPPQSARSP